MRAVMFAAGCLLATAPTMLFATVQSPERIAYVVFGGQIAAVDIRNGVVEKRLEFIHCLRPAERASISDSGDEVTVVGCAAAGGWGRLAVTLSPFRLREYAPLRREPVTAQGDGDDVYPPRPVELKLTGGRASSSASQRGLTLTLSEPGRRERALPVDQHPAESPYESLTEWTVTPDGKTLLVLTNGGFKYQSYLRIYDYPSLRRQATVPLLDILDDVPLAVFVREPQAGP